MLTSIENDVDDSFLGKELVRVSAPYTETKCNGIKDVHPWVSRCVLAKIRMENIVRDNESFVDSSLLRTCKETEIKVKNIVKILMRNDDVQDAAFGTRACKIEDTNEDFLVPEWQ